MFKNICNNNHRAHNIYLCTNVLIIQVTGEFKIFLCIFVSCRHRTHTDLKQEVFARSLDQSPSPSTQIYLKQKFHLCLWWTLVNNYLQINMDFIQYMYFFSEAESKLLSMIQQSQSYYPPLHHHHPLPIMVKQMKKQTTILNYFQNKIIPFFFFKSPQNGSMISNTILFASY